MKAIGAKNIDILLVFMLNAAMVGLVGGVLGVLLGTIVSKLIPYLGISLFLPGGGQMSTVISPGLIIGSLLLAIGIGIISGVIPAYRASKLRPVDALRYE
jgi:putative ABC transport system permease protein